MELKGSQTEKNLWAAFAGESQARNKYTYYASKAKKDGYVQISNIFTETADNEKEHAKIWFKLVEGIGDTQANLKAAAAGEHDEWTSMYPEFAKVAKEEGFDKIAERIYNYPEVKSVYLISGGFDLMVTLEGKTLREVSQFVTDKLSTLDQVLSTKTNFILKKYKDHGTIMAAPVKSDERGIMS